MSRGKIDKAFDQPLDDFEATDSQIGQTSQSAGAVVAAETDSKSKKKLLDDFSLFDAMLLVSLICVTLATIRLFFAITQYGGYIWQAPWNTQL